MASTLFLMIDHKEVDLLSDFFVNLMSELNAYNGSDNTVGTAAVWLFKLSCSFWIKWSSSIASELYLRASSVLVVYIFLD